MTWVYLEDFVSSMRPLECQAHCCERLYKDILASITLPDRV